MTIIAMAQMCSGIDPAQNADALDDAAHQARDQGVEMLFCPEMAGLVDRDRKRAARHVVAERDCLYFQRAADIAARHGLWIHAGSAPIRDETDPTRWRNRSLLFAPDGNLVARYDKIHLFDVDLAGGESWRESAAYAPGAHAVTAAVPFGTLGMTICYDLRFAELFIALAQGGADAICVPAAFTVPTGIAHWHVLLRARAIETGCWIIAPAQCGTHADGRRTFGHSLLIDPWGHIVIDMGEGTGVACSAVDSAAVTEARQRIPALQHRRPFDGP